MKTILLALGLTTAVALGQAPTVREPPGPAGALRATTRIFPDGSRATNVVNYEKREAVETVTDAGGKMMRKTWFSLDARDFTTGAIHYDAKGNIRYKESFKRDAADRISETYIYDKEDRLLGHSTFIYDGNGKVIQSDDFDAKGNLIPKKTAPDNSKPKRRR